ncbi:unnamed protein product [Arabis nemorensis]|uniref:Uncharacterized protein n=1 Tax=Arabis nemorensis TaxID=586526 RepID=A0A565BCD4_9BRAS|nr:unnamed protein product [Arabis nemorensis]
MDYEDEEDERSEVNTYEVDWGEEPNNSWEEESNQNWWEEETNSKISLYEEDRRVAESWCVEASLTNGFDGLEHEELKFGEEHSEPEGYFEEKDNHQGESWHENSTEETLGDKTDSEISYENELEREEEEPEPLDHDAKSYISYTTSNNYENYSSDYDENYEREFDKDRPWCEETDSQISLVETDPFDEEPWNNKAEPGDSFSDESKFEEEVESFNNTNQSESWEYSTEDEVDFKPYHICFAGHHQGPYAYLRRARDMEDWLQANQISEEEKTSYAEDTLTEDAFRQWEQDAYIRLEYDVPDASWE